MGFYLPDIVAIVQCDGLGKVMAFHIVLPRRNPTLDDSDNVPTSLVKLSLSAHSFCNCFAFCLWLLSLIYSVFILFSTLFPSPLGFV